MSDRLEEILEKAKRGESIKLDLGCGNRCTAGYYGVDSAAFVTPDILCDIEKGIPIPDGCVEAVVMNDFIEHVDDILGLMREVWRVCKHGASVVILAPHAGSDEAYQDPTHKHFFTEAAATYWDKRSPHYTNTDYGVDFMFETIQVRFQLSPEVAQIPENMREFAIRHWRNLISRVEFTLKVVKEVGNEVKEQSGFKVA